MSRTTAIFLGIGLTGVAALVAFNLIGASVDENGWLREPFFLLPVGYALSILGFGGAAVSSFLRRRRGG